MGTFRHILLYVCGNLICVNVVQIYFRERDVFSLARCETVVYKQLMDIMSDVKNLQCSLLVMINM